MPQNPTFPNSNSNRIKGLHENQPRLNNLSLLICNLLIKRKTLLQINNNLVCCVSRFAEKAVLGHFILLALLWLFRDPKFMKGWAIIFEKE